MRPTIPLALFLACIPQVAGADAGDEHRHEVRRALANARICSSLDRFAFAQCWHANAELGLCEAPEDTAVMSMGPGRDPFGLQAELVGFVIIEFGDKDFAPQATEVVRRRFGAVRSCLEHSLTRSECIEGQITARVEVGDSGRPSNADVWTSDFTTEASECIVRAIERWRFWRPSAPTQFTFSVSAVWPQ